MALPGSETSGLVALRLQFRSATVSNDGLAGCHLLLAAHEQAREVDRIEQQRREPAFARDVGDETAQEGEQDRRAVDEQERLQRFLGQILNAEETCIDALEV